MFSIVQKTSRALVEQRCRTWPDRERQVWIRAFDPESAFRYGPDWSPVTQYQNGGVYTRYLAVCEARGLAAELSPAGVKAFIPHTEERGCSERTIG